MTRQEAHPMEPFHYPGKDLEYMSFAHNYHQWIFDLIQPHINPRVAEVGAGIGNFSQFLLGLPSLQRLYMFEPSSNLFPILKNKMGNDSRVILFNQNFKQGCVAEPLQTIIYINVLEHIENDSEEITQAYKALEPGGKLIIFVPALPWLYSKLDHQLGHFRRYTRSSLIKCVESGGFDILQTRYFDIAGILPWFIHCKLLKNTLSAGNASLYDRGVVPLMRRVEALVPPPIGKNILLIAKKPEV